MVVVPFTASLFPLFTCTVVVEPESPSVQVRECDDLVFRMTTSGTYSSPYSVTVVCVPIMAGGGGTLCRVHARSCNIIVSDKTYVFYQCAIVY